METHNIFPEHATALIALMKYKMAATEEYSLAQAKWREASAALDALLGLLGLPNENGMEIKVSDDGRVQIKRPSGVAVPEQPKLVVARN